MCRFKFGLKPDFDKGSSKNDVTASGVRGHIYCVDSTKTLVLKSVTMGEDGGGGQKFHFNNSASIYTIQILNARDI